MQEKALEMALNRRVFLKTSALGIGTAALGSLIAQDTLAAPTVRAHTALPGFPNHKPKAKRIIYLFQSGAPSQMDLFDPKPGLEKHYNQDLPDSIRMGQRLTTMTSGQKKFPVAPSIFKFKQHGESGMWMSDLLPHMSKIADEFCMIRSMHTEAINHDPAITFFQTEYELAFRMHIGSGLGRGIGRMYVVPTD